MLTDIEIAQLAKIKHIKQIAKKAGIKDKYLEPYGNNKAKVNLDIMKELKDKKDGKLVLVTAINPTKAGEGKTTMTIGLGQALCKIGKNAMIALREPSMGPVFGLKGGATGGGYAQVVPMDDINLHFTGDMHAITSSVNLIAACLDNHIHQGNALGINPDKVVWKRALDMNDRVLRDINVGQGPKANGVERNDGFNITVASEVMAILCLSKDLMDFKERIGKCIVAFTYDNKPVTVHDLGVEGAVAVLMKDAIKPNLVQTLENTPVLVHGGPFANIAHGCNSLIATKLAMKLGDITVTEAGFGADLGAEKFLDIKCRYGGLKPNLVVIVATIRALKMHGGLEKAQTAHINVEALKKGMANLAKHIENIKQYNLPYVIAINKFHSDTKKEVKTLFNWCQENGHPVFESDAFAKGSKGCKELAHYVSDTLEQQEENNFEFIYDTDLSIKEKILAISQKIYGAKDVEYSEKAEEDIKEIIRLGKDKLVVCMAKTPMSLSDNPALIGRPTDFTMFVKEVRLSAGAGLIVPLCGSILTMPGLPKDPAANHIDIDEEGTITGLF